jgi:hypothetical protein
MTGSYSGARRAARSKLRNRLSAVVFVMLVGALLLGLLAAGVAAQPESPITLDQGQGVEVTCHTGAPSLVRTESGTYQLTCAGGPAAPGATGAANPSPSGAPVPAAGHAQGHAEVGVCGEPMDAWHPPVVNGCATGHEHGDAPPAWIAQAGYSTSFHGAFNTSATEHTYKHAGMKGFLTRFADVDIYFRIHAASNVLDRAARYHSYQVWARDPSGGVSHWQGWYNSGDPLADRFPRRRGVETDKRPAILVVDETSWEQGSKGEQGEDVTAPWSWDFGWTICGINSLYYPGENGQQDQRFWRAPPGESGVGTLRRLEAAWYDNTHGRMHPVGQFWATQFGEIVAGPDDPRCFGATTKFEQEYRNVCLEQFIAPTMKEVSYPNINAEQRQFDGTGVRVPN